MVWKFLSHTKYKVVFFFFWYVISKFFFLSMIEAENRSGAKWIN